MTLTRKKKNAVNNKKNPIFQHVYCVILGQDPVLDLDLHPIEKLDQWDSGSFCLPGSRYDFPIRFRNQRPN
jgi:hypothetical protein